MDRGGYTPPTGVGVKGGERGPPASLTQEAPNTYANLAKKRNHKLLKRNSLEIWIEQDSEVRVDLNDQFMAEVMKVVKVDNV